MKYFICSISIAPVRTHPSFKSEMGTQILFGEVVELLEKKGKQWYKVRCDWDNYIGWVNAQQLLAITPNEFADFRKNFAYALDLVQPLIAPEHFLPITIGARLPGFDGLRFQLEDQFYSYTGQAAFPQDIKLNLEFVLRIARRYLYAPFLWGGRSPMGIDSSGLVQMIFQLSGLNLPREPLQQLEHGETIDFVEQARAGDLAFFENQKGRIVHVGMLMSKHEVIHAFGKVQIDRLDHYGIFDEKKQSYTHRLRLVKRVLKNVGRLPEKAKEVEKVIENQMDLF